MSEGDERERMMGRRGKNGRADNEDTKGMLIVATSGAGSSASGSALSLSPAMSTSFQSRMARRRLAEGMRRGSMSTFSEGSEKMEQDEAGKGPSVIIEPGRPSALEVRWINEMSRDKDKVVVENFDA
jgi:hypothetical protein